MDRASGAKPVPNRDLGGDRLGFGFRDHSRFSSASCGSPAVRGDGLAGCCWCALMGRGRDCATVVEELLKRVVVCSGRGDPAPACDPGGIRSKRRSGRGSSRNPRRSPPRYESRPDRSLLSFTIGPNGHDLKDRTSACNDRRPDHRPRRQPHQSHPRELFDHRGAVPTPADLGARCRDHAGCGGPRGNAGQQGGSPGGLPTPSSLRPADRAVKASRSAGLRPALTALVDAVHVCASNGRSRSTENPGQPPGVVRHGSANPPTQTRGVPDSRPDTNPGFASLARTER